MNPFNAASDLADRGIPTFPCNPDKSPRKARGFYAATIDPQPADFPEDTLIGMPTGQVSGLDVLDIDTAGLDWLDANLHRIPATRTVHTRSGGLHLYFRADPWLRCSAGRIAPGVDVRAGGGYVIRWDVHGGRVEESATVAAWPSWLLDAATAARVRVAGDPARQVAAPSVAAVLAVLATMPNPDDLPRDEYTRIMLAARGCCGEHADDEIGEAACEWAARWVASPGFNAESAKWATDYARRAAPLAGWESLLAAAGRLGVDTLPWRAATAAEAFPALPDEPGAAAGAHLLEMTEDTAALAFAAEFADRFVYEHTGKRWLEFTPGVGWAPDQDGSISRAVRGFVRRARVNWGEESSKSAAKIAFASAVERGCQCDERFARTSQIWDADPLMLGVPGGSVDLRTGHISAAAPARYILRLTTVAPAPVGEVPTAWLRFLGEATGGNQDLQAWLQRLLGYSLTGNVSEEMLAFFYGAGGNGKGVLLHTVSTILGAYAYQAPAELFKADCRANREYQLAGLDGVRLLLASETESGAALAESFVKELTGNEGKLNARHPYGRPFEFKPQCKLIIVGNHAPKLNGRSAAMERRLQVVPFDRKPETPDLGLKDKLVTEYPAILRWMIDGCLAWQRDGLGTVAAIQAASQAYFSEQDSLSQFVAERCEVGLSFSAGAEALRSAFCQWLRARGEQPVNAHVFKESLSRMQGINPTRGRTGSIFQGIRLISLELSDAA